MYEAFNTKRDSTGATSMFSGIRQFQRHCDESGAAFSSGTYLLASHQSTYHEVETDASEVRFFRPGTPQNLQGSNHHNKPAVWVSNTSHCRHKFGMDLGRLTNGTVPSFNACENFSAVWRRPPRPCATHCHNSICSLGVCVWTSRPQPALRNITARLVPQIHELSKVRS